MVTIRKGRYHQHHKAIQRFTQKTLIAHDDLQNLCVKSQGKTSSYTFHEPYRRFSQSQVQKVPCFSQLLHNELVLPMARRSSDYCCKCHLGKLWKPPNIRKSQKTLSSLNLRWHLQRSSHFGQSWSQKVLINFEKKSLHDSEVLPWYAQTLHYFARQKAKRSFWKKRSIDWRFVKIRTGWNPNQKLRKNTH